AYSKSTVNVPKRPQSRLVIPQTTTDLRTEGDEPDLKNYKAKTSREEEMTYTSRGRKALARLRHVRSPYADRSGIKFFTNENQEPMLFADEKKQLKFIQPAPPKEKSTFEKLMSSSATKSWRS